jgi:hypothetical protein
MHLGKSFERTVTYSLENARVSFLLHVYLFCDPTVPLTP